MWQGRVFLAQSLRPTCKNVRIKNSAAVHAIIFLCAIWPRKSPETECISGLDPKA